MRVPKHVQRHATLRVPEVGEIRQHFVAIAGALDQCRTALAGSEEEREQFKAEHGVTPLEGLERCAANLRHFAGVMPRP